MCYLNPATRLSRREHGAVGVTVRGTERFAHFAHFRGRSCWMVEEMCLDGVGRARAQKSRGVDYRGPHFRFLQLGIGFGVDLIEFSPSQCPPTALRVGSILAVPGVRNCWYLRSDLQYPSVRLLSHLSRRCRLGSTSLDRSRGSFGLRKTPAKESFGRPNLGTWRRSAAAATQSELC